MARRRRKGTAEDIMDIVAALPWWMGVALAAISFIVFHFLSSRRPPAMTDARQIGSALPVMMLAGISLWLQYLVPVLCLFGAAASSLRRKTRAELAAQVTQSASADALTGMTWREFELLVAEAFRLQGYRVSELGGAQPDGGVDLVLRRGTESFLVQCKQWKATKVGVDVVRQLYGVMAAQGAAGGFVVTSGRFTDDAIAFASGRNLRLVDGPKLFGLLQQARAAASTAARAYGASAPVSSAAVTPERNCPRCSAPMVLRTSKQGARAGSQFWGCSTFPACRGTL